MTAGYVFLVVGVLLAALLVARDRGGALLALGVCLGAALLALVWRAPPSYHPATPKVGGRDDYVGSGACVACHQAEHASWDKTFHRSMTRVADAASFAPELPVRLELEGRSYELSRTETAGYQVVGPDLHAWGALLAEATRRFGSDARRASEFAARAARDLPRVRREIVLVTGSHHYQAFWVEGGEGRELRQLPFVYLLDPSETQRWLPRRDAFLQPPDALPHVARWNANCVQCHSVAGRPAHTNIATADRAANTYATDVVDFGIGCEACHGPGAAHVEHYQNPLARYLSRGEAHAIVNPARLDAARSSAVCGQCHSYFVPRDPDEWWESGFTESYQPGGDLDRSRLILDYDLHRQESLLSRDLDSVFWPDGTIRVGGREYNGLLRSPCFEHGTEPKKLACISCHSMHRSDPEDQLAEGMAGQRACVQCHERSATDVEEHTRHSPSSAGSLCYNCHMPRTTYALLKGIRSHRITSPEVSGDAAEAPNACNLCHLDRTLSWTRRWLSRWWPSTRSPADADPPDMADPSPHEPPASVTWLLAGNAAQRVLLADAMAWPPAVAVSGSTFQRPLLERLLDDPYAAVRHVASRSLRRLDEQPPAAPGSPVRLSPEQLELLSAQRSDVPITISE